MGGGIMESEDCLLVKDEHTMIDVEVQQLPQVAYQLALIKDSAVIGMTDSQQDLVKKAQCYLDRLFERAIERHTKIS